MKKQHKSASIFRIMTCLLMFLAGLVTPTPQPTSAQPIPFGDPAFQRQWDYSDKAVGAARRTWLWGPAPLGPARPERMVGSPARGAAPADNHLVQYFDKARMEFNARDGIVTNGRLVVEMMSGSIQTSLAGGEFFPLIPSGLPIAGDTALDAANRDTPTYVSLFKIATIEGDGPQATPLTGTLITATYTRFGVVGTLPTNTVASALMPRVHTFYAPSDPNAPNGRNDLLGHNIPNVFMNFLTQRGLVSNGPPGQYRTDYLFEGNHWVNAVGLPITEPYWVRVRISGNDSWVMFQAFERRILTYNPSTPDPLWRVEMGNVGQHYKDWRPEPLVASPLGGVRVVQSSPNPTSDVCFGDGAINGSCPPGQLVSVPRNFLTTLRSTNSWARTKPNGWMLLHSDNAIYDMQSSAMVLFKRIDNSVDSVQHHSGQVDYLHGPKRRIEVETEGGLVTTYGTRFSVIVTPSAQVGAGGELLRIVVPSRGGSVTLQPPPPGPNLQAPAPIVVQSGQVLTVIKGPPVSYSTRPTTPAEEQYWAEKVNRLQGIPGLEEITKESESAGPRLVLAYFQPSFTFDDWKSGGTSATPTIPYESSSPAAIDLQLRQAWFAGIDGLVSEWRGAGTSTDQNLGKFLSGAAELLAKGYFTDTLPAPVYPDVKVGINFNMALLASLPDKGASQVGRAISAYAGHPSYLRWDGKPVVFFRDFMSYGDSGRWRQLRDAIDPKRVQLWVGGETNTTWLDVFDAHNILDGGLRENDSEMFAINKGLRSAIDKYNSEHGTHGLWVASAVPGWDNSKLKVDGKPNPNPKVVDRHSGVKYDTSWCAAVGSSPDWVIINSFNDWYQGTQIEPSPSDCGRYLAITTKWSSQYKDGTSTCEP
ncbi:MAG TPA: hypothetical protein VEX13_11015 [Chloroflexia bacterium]|nr:hypothetical protein [Chloroflexia bacterium]